MLGLRGIVIFLPVTFVHKGADSSVRTPPPPLRTPLNVGPGGERVGMTPGCVALYSGQRQVASRHLSLHFPGTLSLHRRYLCPMCVPLGGGGGMWGIFGKPLKRAIWNTLGLHAVLTTCLRFSSVSDIWGW